MRTHTRLDTGFEDCAPINRYSERMGARSYLCQISCIIHKCPQLFFWQCWKPGSIHQPFFKKEINGTNEASIKLLMMMTIGLPSRRSWHRVRKSSSLRSNAAMQPWMVASYPSVSRRRKEDLITRAGPPVVQFSLCKRVRNRPRVKQLDIIPRWITIISLVEVIEGKGEFLRHMNTDNHTYCHASLWMSYLYFTLAVVQWPSLFSREHTGCGVLVCLTQGKHLERCYNIAGWRIWINKPWDCSCRIAS